MTEVAPIAPSTRAVGFWSAVLATGFSLAYVVGQLAEWLGLLGFLSRWFGGEKKTGAALA